MRKTSQRRGREGGGGSTQIRLPINNSYITTLNEPTPYDCTFTLSFFSPCCTLSINSLLAIPFIKKKGVREGGLGGRRVGGGRGASRSVLSSVCPNM